MSLKKFSALAAKFFYEIEIKKTKRKEPQVELDTRGSIIDIRLIS
jgi:hypothetical protein